jgi:hypothetical protein
MPRNGIDEEESAFAPRCRRNVKSRDRAALQETKEVTLGLLGSETLRYVPIDENLLAEVRRESIVKVRTVTEHWFCVGCDIFRGFDGV